MSTQEIREKRAVEALIDLAFQTAQTNEQFAEEVARELLADEDAHVDPVEVTEQEMAAMEVMAVNMKNWPMRKEPQRSMTPIDIEELAERLRERESAS